MKRPLMFLACLLLTEIVLFSRFYHPSYNQDHIVSHIRSGEVHEPLICQGWIADSPKENETGAVKLFIKLDGCKDGEVLRPFTGNVQLTVVNQRTSVPAYQRTRYGDTIRFRSKLREPVDFKNPGSFKYKRYCRTHDIDVLGYVNDTRWVTKIGDSRGNPVRRWVEGVRTKIDSSLVGIKDKEVRGIARALVIGERGGVSEEIGDNFRKSGVSHLLVISGLHVGFAAIVLFFIFKLFFVRIPGLARKTNILKYAAVCTIVGVWLYAYLTGAATSTVRASIMITVYLAGILLDKRQDLFTTLSLAALIIVAMSPLAVFDVSFQLSFVAVMGIAMIYPALSELIKWKNYIIQIFLISLSATIAITPLVAFYFHYSSVAGIFVNMLAVPWVGFVVTPVSLIIALLGSISGTLAHPFVLLLGYLIWPLMKFVELAAQISSNILISFTPPKMAVIMFYHALIFLIYRKHLRFARYVIGLFVFLMIGSLAVQHGWFRQEKLEVIFLDVGQGASVVVRFPDDKVMVVDAGGSKSETFDIGKMVVAPYLWHEGINRVDWLVATHPHPDHFGGLSFLAEAFRPAAFYWNGIVTDEGEYWNRFIGKINNLKIPVEILKEGDKRLEDGVAIDFLSPPEIVPKKWNTNNTSIVTKITYNDISFLLTGDIEREAEMFLIATSNRQLATVLQVPHHASKTSSTLPFLSAVRPQYAVAQMGENNSYGFPHKKTLENYQAIGATLYRTDQNGAVSFSTDGETLKVFPFTNKIQN